MTDLVRLASNTVMTASDWNIETWMDKVVREELSETSYGVNKGIEYKSNLNSDLREALLRELSFKSCSEDMAARALCHLANIAPSNTDFQYLLTHTLDESRHANNFAKHFYKVYGEHDKNFLVELYRAHKQDILDPLQKFFDNYVLVDRNYYCGVAIIAIMLEGVLAPSSELSEIKWRPFDERASQVQKSANEDEVRHLCVCAEILKEGMQNSEQTRQEVIECIRKGFALWDDLPVIKMLEVRETFYQKGMKDQLNLIEDYEIEPGVLLKDTHQNERINIASQWSQKMQADRLEYLGILKEIENG